MNFKEIQKTRPDLRYSKKLYRILFEQTSDYVLVLELVGPPEAPPIIIDANEAALEKHGYSREELIGQPITFLDRMSENEMAERHRLVQKGGTIHFEAIHTCKNGSTFYADVALQHIDINGRHLPRCAHSRHRQAPCAGRT